MSEPTQAALRPSEHPSAYKYAIGDSMVANTLIGAQEQKRLICRFYGRNPKTVRIVLTATGETVTRRMAERLRAEESETT